jgi:hypothetical protein
MSTTRAFDLQVPSKFSSFKNKNPASIPETSATVSSPSDNLIAEMAIDVKNSTSNGNHAIIDFQADFRPILMALCYYAATNYDALNVKQHSKVSPPTLVAYFLFLLYSYYLLCDLDIRPTPSVDTRFFSTPEHLDLKALMLQLPVPDFLVKFLQAATPTSDPRRPNISFVPSLACFLHRIDFGRLFPIGIFFQSHNFVLSQRTNDAPEQLMNLLMGVKVFDTERIGNYFGQLLSDGTTNFSYGHQLFQSFEGIINPALARSRSQRTVYSRIHYLEPILEDVKENGYLYAMALDDDNISETVSLMRQLQTTVSSTFKITGTLSSVMSSLTGMNILIHGYSHFAVPTWHYTNVPESASSATLVSAKTFANKLKFLTDPPTTGLRQLKYPDDDTKINPSLYLVEKTEATGFPGPSDLVSYKNRNQSVPPVRIMDPYDYNATTFHNAFLSGAFIESLELDSAIVPLPNTDTALDDENTFFLQSAVPVTHVESGTSFAFATVTTSWYENRSPIGPSGQPSSIMLANSGTNRFPSLNRSVYGHIPSALPMFNVQAHINRWYSISNRIAFTIPVRFDPDNSTSTISGAKKILVWSPYRYNNGTARKESLSVIYLITNLRTLFGTNPPLGEVSHFLETIPVA